MRVVVDGKKLRAARIAKLLGPEQLAKKAGLSVKTTHKMAGSAMASLGSSGLGTIRGRSLALAASTPA